MLKEVVLLCVQKICKEKNIEAGDLLSANRNRQNKIIEELVLLGEIGKKSQTTAKTVLVTCYLSERGVKTQRSEAESKIRKVEEMLKEAFSPKAGNAQKKTYIKRPRFKNMEKKCEENAALVLKTKYPGLAAFTETAEKRRADGEYDDALHSLRNALEFIVNTLCKKYGIAISQKTTLLEKIDLAENAGVISDSQRDILHRARKLGNIGAHQGIDKADENKVQQAQELIAQAVTVFANLVLTEESGENKPVIDPEFYNSSRKYYGMWNNATRIENLMLNMKYVTLERKAAAGDIEAMIDIATGFLPNPDNRQWGLDRLILSPNLEKSGYTRYPDPYEARYYFWILRAGQKAYDDWMEGKTIPLKYIATVLAEGIKFMYCHDLYLYYCYRSVNKTPRRNVIIGNSQYKMASLLFSSDGISYSSETVEKFAVMLLCMLEEYKADMEAENGNIIAPIHCMDVRTIRHYVYMENYYVNPEKKINFDPRLLIRPDDMGKTFYKAVKENEKMFTHTNDIANAVQNSFSK